MYTKLAILGNNKEINDVIKTCIKAHAEKTNNLSILEAGCGRSWPFSLENIRYRLTGIDADRNALDSRKNIKKDIDEVILGDLRTVNVPASSYDIIYSSFVLEHISGADLVLNNFSSWLKPGGIMILKFPDRDSVYGFITRITPFWFHVFYKKYIMGNPNAGKPGFNPYPTYHDAIISRKVFYDYVAHNQLNIREEFGFGKLPYYQLMFTKIISFLSFGRLASGHINLVYVLEKNQNDQQ